MNDKGGNDGKCGMKKLFSSGQSIYEKKNAFDFGYGDNVCIGDRLFFWEWKRECRP